MQIHILRSKEEASREAAAKAADLLIAALAEKAKARFVAVTGASQFEFLQYLVATRGIDWTRTVMFHLDEYVGIPAGHPASFRRYLQERLVEKVQPGEVHVIRGDAKDPQAECRRLAALISQADVDVAFVGIGENGHLAFNDPPADFETDEPYLVVALDEACRRQQVGEGWFRSMGDVPRKAITMSIRQIMKARSIICTVPDARKAEAVRDCLADDAEISPMHPASILKRHDRAHVFLDSDSAALLR